MTAVLPERPTVADDPWAARYAAPTPPPAHARDCWLADYGIPAEVCACTSPDRTPPRAPFWRT